MMNSKREKVSKMNYKYCMRKYCRHKGKKRKKDGCVTDSEDKILNTAVFKWKIKFIFCLSRKLILPCFLTLKNSETKLSTVTENYI